MTNEIFSKDKERRQNEINLILANKDIPRPMLEAAALALRKAQDYNSGVITRNAYFPMGLTSYVQMINVKALRLVSLISQPGTPNFENARDTLLDLINYATFAVEWLDKETK